MEKLFIKIFKPSEFSLLFMIMIVKFRNVLFVICALLMVGNVSGQQQRLRIDIDGTKKLQTIDGIGVNINTRSWSGAQLEPAIDLLLDSMQATI